jgi:hypothetical protein
VYSPCAMRQALALRSGTELDIYLVTGKLKHPRVFWLEIGDKCVCWGKRRCAASPPRPCIYRSACLY